MTTPQPEAVGQPPERERADHGADALGGDEHRRRSLVAVEDHGGHLRDERDERRADQDRHDHQRDHPAHVGVRPGEAEAVAQRAPHRPGGRRSTAPRRTASTHPITARKLIALHHSAAPMPPMRDGDAGQRRADDATEVPLGVGEPDGGDEVLPRARGGAARSGTPGSRTPRPSRWPATSRAMIAGRGPTGADDDRQHRGEHGREGVRRRPAPGRGAGGPTSPSRSGRGPPTAGSRRPRRPRPTTPCRWCRRRSS